ncbi:hypothetical protein EW145_g8476 [Phellinidium pouzarii]|uniref:Uroporphyrinogen decarboxylase (URO-D) domain-containing protein n=1 Tax=Phellinidium pouzarii TaxID=167371 RepID=A0A4S4K5T8_9AGAM|nr:hypothetical protein EW145_g8476 [Phellinidium pouzarii]
MRIADVCADFLVGQVKAGAQLLQIFDSWAGELSPHDFALYSLPSLRHISQRVRASLASSGAPAIPMTLFAKGAHQPETLAALAAAPGGYDVLGLDCASASSNIAFQGNLDPNVLYGGRAAIEREVARMCAEFRASDGGDASAAPRAWIANLGHGITPGVDPEDMRFFLECVHKYSAKGAAP